MMLSSGPIVVCVALVLGVAAQGWINGLAGGDRGLSSYLGDGSGYSGSGFSEKPTDADAVSGDDPQPWLKLPKLDFVEVAGQNDGGMEEQLERIRQKMNRALEEGQMELATELRQELEEVMTENDFDFTSEGSFE